MTFVKISQKNHPQVREIYEQGLTTGVATFETKSKDWEAWDKTYYPFGRIAAIDDSQMLGWIALTPVSTRTAYNGVAEISVYIAEQHRRQGVGEALIKKVINVSEQNSIWTLQAGIFKANMASRKLHEKCGFRLVGFRDRLAQLNGIWHDHVLYERRSQKVGI